VQRDSSGPSWAAAGSRHVLALSKFFVASPSTPSRDQRRAGPGKDLILTPGVYNLNLPIVVSRSDTVVLGLGLAPVPSTASRHDRAAQPRVKLSGLIIDAGPVNSPVLLSVGTPGSSSASDPDLIQDVYFRIGGAETRPVSATVSLLDNAGNSIIDNSWVWLLITATRSAGPSTPPAPGWSSRGQRDAYGLAVEHYQKDEVIWSGQGGTDIFFQKRSLRSASQSAWMETPSRTAIPLSSSVQRHDVQGLRHGQLSFFNQGVTIYASTPSKPDNPNVQFQDVFTRFLSGSVASIP